MKRILIIEDEDALRVDLITALNFEGYEAIGAENGRDGVRAARQHLPDLIICDISMPELDGFGVIVELRSHSQTASIPVIILSGHAEQETVQYGMRLGAAHYLRKPYTLDELFAAIESQIG